MASNSNIKIQTFLPVVERTVKISRALTLQDKFILNYCEACVAKWLTP